MTSSTGHEPQADGFRLCLRFGHFPHAQQAGELILTQRFVYAHRHGVAEIQAPGLVDHGQTEDVYKRQLLSLNSCRNMRLAKSPAGSRPVNTP